jgi:hypothetical protein
VEVKGFRGGPERQVLIGVVTSTPVCGAVAGQWDGDLFDSRWSNLVAGWAVSHYQKYRKAPRRAVEGYFDRWAAGGGRDGDTVKLIEKFLAGLSEESRRSRLAPEYLLDLAAAHFNNVRAVRHAEQLKAAAEGGETDKVLELARKFRPVEVGRGACVNIFRDEALVATAFDPKDQEDIVVFPGAAGKFFRHALARDNFIAFEGMAKIGKSFWLLAVAWQALKQRRRVALFEAGDMSQNQVIRRLGARAAKRPVYGDPKHPVKIPVGMESGDPPVVEYLEKLCPEDLDFPAAWKALQRFGKKFGEDNFRLSVHPNRSISVLGIEDRLGRWEREGWVPDVLTIDYADLLAPVNGKIETRDQLNETWQGLRALSQKLHCLLVTATQSDTASYNAKSLGRENFSGDRRKNDHVVGMVGINQTKGERENGLYRLNWAVPFRELDYGDKELWCASCLALADPCVLSTF